MEPAVGQACSAVLIAPDLVMTAGHCVEDAADCAGQSLVFDFVMGENGAPEPLTQDDIYRCDALIARRKEVDADYAFLRLDRPTQRKPARLVRDSVPLAPGQGVAMIGHGLGLPLKITMPGEISTIPEEWSSQPPDFFATTLDVFGGNSGGPVVLDVPGDKPVLGVVTSASNWSEYEYDRQNGCHRFERSSMQHVTAAQAAWRALPALCASSVAGSYPELCGCGDDTCSAPLEDSLACLQDCGTACGDGLCGQGETPKSCASDCGTCGDGECGAQEDCCLDCGCEGSLTCVDNHCAMPSSQGSDCRSAIPVDPLASQTLYAQSQPDGDDQYVRFTLDEPRYYRTYPFSWPKHGDTCQDVAGEVARAPLLQPGTYVTSIPSPRETGSVAPFELHLMDPQTPDGRVCETAPELQAEGHYTVRGDTRGMGLEFRCLLDAHSCAAEDVFYRFHLDAPAHFSAELTGFPHVVLLLTRDRCNTGNETLVAHASALGGEGRASMHRGLPAGNYFLRVTGMQAPDVGPYALALAFDEPERTTGDHCSEPIELSSTGVQRVSGTTVGAQNDQSFGRSNDYYIEDDFNFRTCNVPAFAADRVYQFTLTEKKRVRARVTGDFPVQVALTEGVCTGDELRCATRNQTLERTLDPGAYFVWVDGAWHGDRGSYQLEVEFEDSPVPKGETCEDALPVPATGQQTVSGSLLGTQSDNVGECTSRESNWGDRVYTFTLAEPRTVRLSLTGDEDIGFEMMSPCRNYGKPGTGCLSRSSNLSLEAGTYFVALTRRAYRSGNYTLSFDFESSPEGQTCSDAIPLTLGEAPVTVEATASSSIGYWLCSDAPRSEQRTVHYSVVVPYEARIDARVEVAAGGGVGLSQRASSGRACDTTNPRALSTVIAPGTYCLAAGASAGSPDLVLTASLTPGSSEGSSCESAIALSAPGVHALAGRTSFFDRMPAPCGNSFERVYTFVLDEPSIVRARMKGGYDKIELYEGSCEGSALSYCGSGFETLRLDPGRYFLKVETSSPNVPIQGELEIDCDTDDDGTCDAADACPYNESKTAPGQCGCNYRVDYDNDGDGVADCIDGCSRDPTKATPGVCGCGTADTDTDADATPDCSDVCPRDALKIAAGICGCGVADTDTDRDGTADCNDGCREDGSKVAAGVCGCGVLDTDTDRDGTADCNDGCREDGSKVAAGVCGCGVSDTDTDRDGTADCNDGCRDDATKVAAGICGCGVLDTDTDRDGTADCNDGCREDASKVAAGVCGCGVLDTDTDRDGTADCNDGCREDASKVAAGVCGCGVADTDTDRDGTADCNDGCREDASKVAAGVCGCGGSDTDTDRDGTADCNDGCPDDASKVAAGVCGCGVADTDTDRDGTADCNDGCREDGSKVAAGVCGCGVSDADTDRDGTADCNDGCREDGSKVAAGICGCGVADTDADRDGTADCNDGCPADASKVAAGVCGCGTPEQQCCEADPTKCEPQTPPVAVESPEWVRIGGGGGCAVGKTGRGASGARASFAWLSLLLGAVGLRRRRR